jgi:prepilin-type N-terminal cleavage/methylation domain-containing protein
MVAPRRPAFTLLEVVLATAIGVILLAALYTAMGLQLRYAKAGRDVVEKGNLVRSLMARIRNDITQNLGPQNMSAGSSAAASSAGAGAGSPSTTSPDPSGGSNTSNNQTPAATAISTQITFNLGVQGDASRLILYVSRVPREALLVNNASGDVVAANPGISDLRRITYWLAHEGGLAWQEVLQVTSDEAMNVLPPNVPNETNFVIADEVKSLAFSYFDGTNWQDTWDGTVAGPDGQTPIGPPLAIKMEMEIATPGSQKVEKYSQVVFIPTANGLGQPPANANNPTSNTGGSMP